MVKAALLLLRVYLVVMLALIGMKFVRVFTAAKSRRGEPAAPAAPVEPAPPAADATAGDSGK